jgi:hypothetical protein
MGRITKGITMTTNTGPQAIPFGGIAPDAIGIPWYRRDDYPAILALMADRELLPRTFDAWQKRAEEVVREHIPPSVRWHRAYIDPKKFGAWCMLRGLNIDAGARGQFASDPANWDRSDKH